MVTRWKSTSERTNMTVAAALASTKTPARVRLRPTMQSDLDFVLSLEQDPANLPFITPWERMQHEAAIRFPDFRHFIIEAGAGLDAAGLRGVFRRKVLGAVYLDSLRVWLGDDSADGGATMAHLDRRLRQAMPLLKGDGFLSQMRSSRSS